MTRGFEAGPSHFPTLEPLADDILAQLTQTYGLDRELITTKKQRDQIRLSSPEFSEDLYLAVTTFARQFDSETPINYDLETGDIILGLYGPMSYFPPPPTQH